MNDELVVEQIKSGDQKVLSQLYENNRSEFLRWLQKDYHCPLDDTKDLYQVAILIVYNNIQQGKLNHLTSSLKTYLFAVGKNLAHEWNRKVQKSLSLDQNDLLKLIVEDENQNGALDDNIERVHICLEKIGQPCKQLLEWYYFFKKSMEEITTLMNYKNADSAKNQKYKCMERLRKIYDEELIKQTV